MFFFDFFDPLKIVRRWCFFLIQNCDLWFSEEDIFFLGIKINKKRTPCTSNITLVCKTNLLIFLLIRGTYFSIYIYSSCTLLCFSYVLLNKNCCSLSRSSFYVLYDLYRTHTHAFLNYFQAKVGSPQKSSLNLHTKIICQICGPSATEALCGFAFCWPNVFVIYGLKTSAKTYFFSLQI